MYSKRATVLLIMFSLVGLAGGGYANAAQAAAGSAIPGPNCAGLTVTAVTPNISADRNKVLFQVVVNPACSWHATNWDYILQNLNPTQAPGSQVVGAIISSNPDIQSRTATLTITSNDGTVVRTATVTQDAPVADCTGVSVHPTILYPPGGYISVTVPAGWSWYWNPITPLMRYNCTPQYPNGVSCGWGCGVESRVGYAEVVAYGNGRRCAAGVQGNQYQCGLH